MKTKAIIGSSFGDEGKGRMTDVFASKSPGSCIVIRYNGGSQAGHTVVLPCGKTHIFKHIGSGTFTGAVTYLSEFFILNPMIWQEENKELSGMGVNPMVFVNRFAPLTTPYDMFINRTVENFRGKTRHGSCGYGVSETVERLCNSNLHLYFRDIDTPGFEAKVRRIRDEYTPSRLKALGVTKIPEETKRIIRSEELFKYFIQFSIEMKKRFVVMVDDELNKYDTIIFEGSQGLGLDEGHPFFPHVSRSKTGLANISSICHKASIKEIEAIYVTRIYATRHGAGPFPTENTTLAYADETNITNEFQGSLRFGYLDMDLIKENINRDSVKANGIKVKRSIAVTCLDQVDDMVIIKYKGKQEEVKTVMLPTMLGKILNCHKIYVSRSMSRKENDE